MNKNLKIRGFTYLDNDPVSQDEKKTPIVVVIYKLIEPK